MSMSISHGPAAEDTRTLELRLRRPIWIEKGLRLFYRSRPAAGRNDLGLAAVRLWERSRFFSRALPAISAAVRQRSDRRLGVGHMQVAGTRCCLPATLGPKLHYEGCKSG